MNVGVLALQGDFAAHERALEAAGATPRRVRRPEELAELDALVLPGGESGAMLRLARGGPLLEAIVAHARRGGAILGTCAGLILLARRVTAPEQPSLGLLDADVTRNAWGRQRDSFETEASFTPLGRAVRMAFIRAPRIARVGPSARVLASLGGEAVAVQEGRVVGLAFHPEITATTGDTSIHRWFVEEVCLQPSAPLPR